MIKFRFHRAILKESMETVREVSSKAELLSLLTEEFGPFGFTVIEDNVHIIPYVFDDRIDWNTYAVTIDNFGVAGFTDGPL
jgi:hypothetical protein